MKLRQYVRYYVASMSESMPPVEPGPIPVLIPKRLLRVALLLLVLVQVTAACVTMQRHEARVALAMTGPPIASNVQEQVKGMRLPRREYVHITFEEVLKTELGPASQAAVRNLLTAMPRSGQTSERDVDLIIETLSVLTPREQRDVLALYPRDLR